MHRHGRERAGRAPRRLAMLVAALVTAALSLTAVPAGAASGPEDPATFSTPVPIVVPDGALMSYIVNVKNRTPGQMREVADAIEAAHGTVVQEWPEIGVIVAHSTSAAFRTALVETAQNAIASVGATRTTEVVEGTPAVGDAGSAGDPDANRHDVWSARNGDLAAPPTPATSTDPLEAEQWDLALIGADEAHRVTDGSPNVLVGVLDGGIDPAHPDLADRISAADSVNCTAAGRPDTSPTGWRATSSDHGTHVAGTIAAARNGTGIVGVAPAVRLASVKVVNDDGLIYPEYAVCGFMWAARHGMDVTNNSYFVDPFMFYCDDRGDQAAALQAVRRAVAWAERTGVVTVAAAGNESTDLANVTRDATSPNDSTPVPRTINDGCRNIPGELPDVISVSSVAEDGTLSGFSNTGAGAITVAAPGTEILSTVGGDSGWATMSGTSMAAPHVTGVVALIASTHPDWSPEQIRAALVAGARDVACPVAGSTAAAGMPPCTGSAADNSWYGAGLVDAAAAVR